MTEQTRDDGTFTSASPCDPEVSAPAIVESVGEPAQVETAAASHPFHALEAEYAHLLSIAKITRAGPVRAGVDEIMKVLPSYIDTQNEMSIPAAWIGPVDCREDDCNPHAGIGQGDDYRRVSIHVPRGEGPFPTKAAADRFYLRYDHIDVLPPGQLWTLTWYCFRGEGWNGLGPRNHGRLTGYLWACTDVYDPPRFGGYGDAGKYVADNDWDPSAVDSQPGIVALYLELIQRRPDLALAAGMAPPSAPPLVPLPTPNGFHDADKLQNALNQLGADPQLVVDGSYGRMTARAVRAFQSAHGLDADGIAGAETWNVIQIALHE